MHWPKSKDEAKAICCADVLVILNQGHATRLEPSWHPLDGSKPAKVDS